jgi:hypothetical protein
MKLSTKTSLVQGNNAYIYISFRGGKDATTNGGFNDQFDN